MNGSELHNIGAYYDALVDRYGHDPRACDYGDPSTQARKFDILTQVTPLNGHSVLDVGCGFADLARHISASGDSVEYTGIDLSPRMVKEARQLTPSARIEHANVLDWEPGRQYDVVFAIGVFYLLGTDTPNLGQRILERMFALAKKAVAFSTLSSLAKDQEVGEYYWDPSDLIRRCAAITPYFVLRHDYHPRDMTIYLYKTSPGAPKGN